VRWGVLGFVPARSCEVGQGSVRSGKVWYGIDGNPYSRSFVQND
jgi:hypothetical protein